VGVSHIAQIGAVVTEDQPLARVHAAPSEAAAEAAEAVAEAIEMQGGAATPPALVAETIR
jgi:thymidine phosphorylase